MYKSKNACSFCNNDNSLSLVNLECSLPRCISYTGGGGGGGGNPTAVATIPEKPLIG